jgi:hypothetical protein
MKTLKDRLTVVETVYHQPAGEPPVSVDFRFSRDLDSVEQSYRRQLTATEDWKSLDHGWIEQAGMLVIQNLEGKFRANPTDEERAEAAAKVLEVAHRVDEDPAAGVWDCAVWLVLPGESFRGCPSDIKRLVVRSRSAPLRFSVFILPR